MELSAAAIIAERVKAELAPHCERIEIAGSVRRQKPQVKDIEIVAIPKSYDVGLFASGIATIVNRWPKVRGELPCKYTQRTLPDEIALDLFFATADNWGAILLIRTGDSDFSRIFCGSVLPRNGYKQEGGFVRREGFIVPVREEAEMFRLAGVEFIDPRNRTGESLR